MGAAGAFVLSVESDWDWARLAIGDVRIDIKKSVVNLEVRIELPRRESSSPPWLHSEKKDAGAR
jgi:hypothetical protein